MRILLHNIISVIPREMYFICGSIALITRKKQSDQPRGNMQRNPCDPDVSCIDSTPLMRRGEPNRFDALIVDLGFKFLPHPGDRYVSCI